MSEGATGSGDDAVVGRTNWADGRSILWAKVPPGTTNFWGEAILYVEAAKDYSPDDDKDEYDEGTTYMPTNRFHGIVATGHSDVSPLVIGGDSGVVGRGGTNQGTGVVGLGGGNPLPELNGAGGIGVLGLGGSESEDINVLPLPITPPGAGVVGQGGRQPDLANTRRLPHGAGVIGLGGGTGLNHDSLPLHTLMQTGGVGVYAQGAEAAVTMVPPPGTEPPTPPGPDVPSGPTEPGVGVLGRGGVFQPPDPNGQVAAGVIGLAGDTAIPPFSETRNNGVYGGGPVGVFGHGPTTGVRGKSEGGSGVSGETDKGSGVLGLANGREGRGGQFQTSGSAQVWLVPQNQPFSSPATAAASPMVISTEGEGPKLPRDGRGGDLLAISDKDSQCTLWFCVQGEGVGPALWAQVLLGPSSKGKA